MNVLAKSLQNFNCKVNFKENHKLKSFIFLQIKTIMSKRTAEIKEEDCQVKKSRLLVKKENVKELSLLEEVTKSGALLKDKGKSLRARCNRYLIDKKKAENSSGHKTIGDELITTANRYYFENGLRKVEPYFFTFDTFAKDGSEGL